MIRVLHLITTLEVGGAETSLVRLVTRLDPSRFSCAVVALAGPATLARELDAAGIETHTVSDARGVGPGALRRLAALVRRFRPDVLQTWLYHADLLGLAVGRALRVPSIGWNVRCADLESRDHPRSLFWLRSLLARLSARPDFVVVNSEAGRSAHEGIGYRPRRWARIPNGIDTEAFAPSAEARHAVRGELGIPPNAPVVGLVARYHPMKDHATFVAACAEVRRHCPELRVLMAGRGVDDGNRVLGAALAAHGLSACTRLLGEVTRPAGLLAALDVSVSSSYGEAFPNIVAEAMATGVPVVATDAGDSALIVGECGSVVPARDPAALAHAVGRVLSMPPEARRALGCGGRERIVREFSMAAAVARYETLYEEFGQRAGRVGKDPF
jgi:glycosyltransferase involved in cell wall biosynthesis